MRKIRHKSIDFNALIQRTEPDQPQESNARLK